MDAWETIKAAFRITDSEGEFIYNLVAKIESEAAKTGDIELIINEIRKMPNVKQTRDFMYFLAGAIMIIRMKTNEKTGNNFFTINQN